MAPQLTSVFKPLAATAAATAPATSSMEPPPFPTLSPAQLAALPHDDKGPQLLMILWMLIALSAAFLSLRLYCKHWRAHGLWWDDHILIAAWLAVAGSTSFVTYSVTLGYGKHGWDIPPQNFIPLVLPANLGGGLSIFASVWSKTSFAITLLRLLRQTNSWMKWVVWFILISMNVAMTGAVVMTWTQCTPFEKNWNPLVPGTCFTTDRLVKYNIFSSAYSAGADIVLALLPWKLIWSLQMKRIEKLGVSVAMSMGVFAGLTSFIKITHISSMTALDIQEGTELVMWGTAESTVTIMAASVPALRFLVRQQQQRAKAAYVPPDSNPPPLQDNFEMQSRSTVTIESISLPKISSRPTTASRGGSISSWISWKGEDRSNRNSMELHFPGEGKIMEIREVSVEYDDTNNEEALRASRLALPSRGRPARY